MGKVSLDSLFNKMSLVASSSLGVLRTSIEHPVMKGTASECYWINLLREYLPIKFGINSGKVVDSKGNTSKQIDIIIYSRESFPYVFNQNGAVLIPVESVVGVLEVKQDIKGNMRDIANKIESVRNLEGSYLDKKGQEAEIPWPPYPILGGVLSTQSSYSEETLKNKLSELKGSRTIDIGCCANKYSFFVKYNTPEKEIANYKARAIAKVHTYSRETALMVFIYQLVHTLQRNAFMSCEYSVNIDAYLRNVGAEINPSPIATPLF